VASVSPGNAGTGAGIREMQVARRPPWWRNGNRAHTENRAIPMSWPVGESWWWPSARVLQLVGDLSEMCESEHLVVPEAFWYDLLRCAWLEVVERERRRMWRIPRARIEARTAAVRHDSRMVRMLYLGEFEVVDLEGWCW
jgi:hypothetical protein